jgi:hypothetical protein
MMFNPMLQNEIAGQRQQDMMRQAHLRRLRRSALGPRASWSRRWLARLGDGLVAAGMFIRQRCERAAQRRAAAHAMAAMDFEWERL